MSNSVHSRAHHQGYILLLTLVFFAILFTAATAYLNFVTSSTRSALLDIENAQALTLAEAGMDEAVYELNQNPGYTGESDTALGSGVFTVSVASVDSKTKRVTATGYVPNSQSPLATKTIRATVGITDSVVSFHYGVQSGQGGFILNNSSKITGNVFSGGSIIGNNNNYILGDIVSSGPTGEVYGVHATGTVYAHTIGKANVSTVVDKDAYYTTKINTTVTGVSHPNSPDQPTAPLPIPDDQITAWESQAEAGGTISSCDGSGDYNITSNTTLGPKKIACNLVVKGSGVTLSVTGPIWVVGDITTQTGPTIRIDPSLGSANVGIIADDPAAPLDRGLIDIGQSTVFQGSGAPGSFVFLISQNKSAEQGGSKVAVSMGQGASALVAYANHGLINLNQSVSVKEVTGYKIALFQSANVVYDTGLPSTVFQSGPGGSWVVVPKTYSIVP
jgi:hypothetical protein